MNNVTPDNIQEMNITPTLRPLADLNLLDDFLMNKISSSPEVGEPFLKEILNIILKVNLQKVSIVPQKVYYGITPQMHGTRIDVYVEGKPDNQEEGSIYDIEPENAVNKKSELPQRVRFYHAKIDMGCLKAGDSYKYLKQVYVIVISSFDPFDRNRMVYTIRNQCVEAPELPYDDGATTIFLYTQGTEGNPPKDLAELLHYMEDTRLQNATNEQLLNIHKMVAQVKSNKEVSIEYMKIAEREEMIREEAIEKERLNTERERKRAEQADKRAIQETLRADSAEEEIRRLKEELKLYKQ